MPRRPTRDPYARPAIQTLERLHAELGGKILANKQEHDNLAEQMRHVEAVLKMLDPSYEVRRIAVKRRKANPWFKRGTLYRKALDVLRKATEPMTAKDAALRTLARPSFGTWLARSIPTFGAAQKAWLCRNGSLDHEQVEKRRVCSVVVLGLPCGLGFGGRKLTGYLIILDGEGA